MLILICGNEVAISQCGIPNPMAGRKTSMIDPVEFLVSVCSAAEFFVWGLATGLMERYLTTC
jgi:hypothetical protein